MKLNTLAGKFPSNVITKRPLEIAEVTQQDHMT